MAEIKKVTSVQHFISSALFDIEREEKKALKHFSKLASAKLREFTLDWYNKTEARQSGSSYERTYEFLNSITIGEISYIKGRWEVPIYYDPTKMTLGINNGWRQHEDRYYLSEIIEYGWQVGNKNIEGSEAKFQTMEWAEEFQNFLKSMKESFESDGFRIK